MNVPVENRRREQRFEIDAIILPFLGSREVDHLCFQYIPLDISAHGLKIAIPRWLVSRERLQGNDIINLHAPFRMNDCAGGRGKVVWSRWDESLQAQVCGVFIEKTAPLHSDVFISLDMTGVIVSLPASLSEEDLILKIFKDSVLLKKGVLIYLNHLIPYFSRITLYPAKEYPMLKEFVLDDVKKRIKENIEKLKSLHETTKKGLETGTKISVFLNLEELRSIIESEISLDLLMFTFETETILPFLSAIKELEKKQYSNYNNLVMLYIKSL